MNRIAALNVRNELPRVLRSRLRTRPADMNGKSERMLKDIAFVLHLTRRIRDEMENGK